MLVTKKTAASMGMSIHDGVGSKVSVFARRQMEKMGWQEGKGLGKNETGISKHIKAVKREDSSGLGLESAKAAELSDNWWHDGFSKSLKAFSSSGSGKKTKGKKSSKKSRDYEAVDDADTAPTFAELFAATGGARLGMRARASQKGKHLRTEGSLIEEVAVSLSEEVEEIEGDSVPREKRRKIRHVETVEEEVPAKLNSVKESQEDISEPKKKRKKALIVGEAEDLQPEQIGSTSPAHDEGKKSKKKQTKDA